jgi:hypothetical protein
MDGFLIHHGMACIPPPGILCLIILIHRNDTFFLMVVDTPTTPTTGCYVVVGRTIPVVQQQQGVLQSLGWPSEQCQGCNNGHVSIVEPLTDQGMNGNGLKGWHTAGGGGAGGYLQLLLRLVVPASSSSNNWMMLLSFNDTVVGRQYPLRSKDHRGGMEGFEPPNWIFG